MIKGTTARGQLITRFAICVDNAEYPAALELHKIYRVLPDAQAEKDGDMRVIDESGEDYLYPSGFFMMLALTPKTTRTLSQSFARKLQLA